MKPYREAIRRSWMGGTVHPSTVVSGRDRTPTAATRRQAAKSRCLPHKGGGGSTIRRRILELAKPRIIVRDAGGEIRRALFQEARHPFGGVGAAPAREDRADVPATIGRASCRESVCQYV